MTGRRRNSILAAAAVAGLAAGIALLHPVAKSGLPGPVGETPACDVAVAGLRTLAADPKSAAAIEKALVAEAAGLKDPSWLAGYCVALSANLEDKRASAAEGVAFDAQRLIDTALHYEAFRITAFRNSGVSPKRFFGFLDEHGHTAAYERQLKDVSSRIAPMLNAYAARNGLDLKVTPKEIIVTHLAEGGALLLTRNFADVDRVHPVFGIGLDDYRKGFVRFPGLLEEVDKAFGTRLGVISVTPEAMMTFTESILGTAVMYLYEKEIAENKLQEAGRPSLNTRTLDEQFVVASLVYNSGILFDEGRFPMILGFSSAPYLVEVSAKTADRRPRLPVMLPAAADAHLAAGNGLPDQPTSWNAIYHIMQRYGAWVALTRFSEQFDETGNLKR